MSFKICMLLILLGGGFPRLMAEAPGFTVANSIAMTTFSEPSGLEQDATPLESPDGKYFLVVSSRGLMKSNEVESTIWLFDNSAIQKYLRGEGAQAYNPAPRMLGKVAAIPVADASRPYSPVVSDLRWAPDSRTIYFLDQNSTGQRHLCRIDLKTELVRRLSALDSNVERYNFLGNTIVYTATRATDSTISGRIVGSAINADASAVTGLPVYRILFADGGGWPIPRIHELWSIQNGQAHRVIDTSSSSSQLDTEHADVLSISPDGSTVVQLKAVTNVPASWRSYVPRDGSETWTTNLNTSSSNYFRARQYVSIQLSNGMTHPLIDAPFGLALGYGGEAPQVVWARSGHRLLLANTFVPTADVDARERKEDRACSVVSIEIPSRKARCIVFSRDAETATSQDPKPLRLQSAVFGATEDEVVLQFGWWQDKRSQTEYYHYANGNWRLVTTSTDHLKERSSTTIDQKNTANISVEVRQSLNDPPALWAMDVQSGRSREIWNPNFQFSHMRFGEASVYRWKDKTGFEWAGILVKPVGYVSSKRYPLVVQTHGTRDFEFVTDGQFPTGMAARPLASAGIMVLQVLETWKHVGQLQEATDNVMGYVSAIDQLTADGLIDPKRVGIVGFSRTCWYVESALIEDPKRFAAASINDRIDNSYMQSMLFDPRQESQPQEMYDAKPFGPGLEKWLTLAASFQLYKVHTPLSITAINSPSILQEWEIYSSLYQQNKPVDLIYIPGGQHILQKPLDRLASQQNTVDWFRFWLQDYERPNTEDPDQYKRWEH